ncbi:nonribosomal siderophore peptide synthase Sid2 [Aspergillus ellipticus CBS 707.79]|uniref:Nonribosomal siderophore peptide synthase Sid2 n=1 Tax=Aspergillus ellipticus CBS 707.79 TaxID=1448320 RepID=A0A319D2T7_9EURO|nr:nonribosomal siderophore peptide synthase Sid2 [Aspergillus ellipticus CBS 707.79]
MGNTPPQDTREEEPVANLTNGDGSGALEIAGLASDQIPTPTGMREDVLLVSWLLVLLRTREDGQTSFEWAYQGASEAVHRCESTAVMADLRSSVAQTAAAIARLVSAAHQPATCPASILLSNGALAQTAGDGQEEGALHLEITFHNNRLAIHPVWQTENTLPYTVTRYITRLSDTIELVLSNPDASIQDCLRPTAHDLDDLWTWNHQLPPTYNFCMNEMITERAHEFPDKVGISSWDGDLTYGEIERYSTYVACALKELGVQLDDFIPVCFEKSRWTIVAVLAVMKAGGTFALMDPTLPLARLQNMAVQVNARTMISSHDQHELSKEILPNGSFFVVEEAAFTTVPGLEATPKLPTVPSSTLMYLIFTSGSTGTPKGVQISHETYTSSAIPRAKAVGYTPESRVLDFASYAFDVSIDSMLLTLGNGGCLCIPSDEDRLNDINGVIRKMGVNYAGVTPSVARILEPDVITSLSGLGLGGEAASARDVTLWGKDTRIIIGYGPCECTIGCTINGDTATGRDYISIGTGNGAAIWIVDPNDHESLMPVGAVGELLVEGPIVGQGYLGDPEKTRAAFIEAPQWLVAGHKGYPGRRGRLYKSGDLGKYDPDGTAGIVFAGRKDTQVKLRGQRVELGEIESQLKARLPSDATVIAEVIVPQGTGGQATLIAFVASQSVKGADSTEITSVEFPEELRKTLSEADADVKTVLPRYMVPTAYIPVSQIPVLISGKTDRRRLRQFGATVDLRQLDQEAASTADRELSELEVRLRQAWSETLKLDAAGIRPDDNFFALGGDSLAAMRLASVCRAQGLDLSVANTFGHPTLSGMAGFVRICDVEEETETPASFALISQDADSACLEASQIYGFDRDAIQDMYPCTPTQESLFTFSLKSVKAYVAQRVSSIPSDISIEDWKKAWEDVSAAIPILRTRVAQLQEPGLQQVVLKEGVTWKSATDLAQYLEADKKEKMNLGERLARYAIVDQASDGKRYMVWTVHHVLYDGWSEPIILQKVSDALQGQHPEIQAQMRDFVRYVRATDEVAMEEFWRRELKGAVGPQFPPLPSRDYLPIPDGLIEHKISLETGNGFPFTLATLIRGAWALVASQYTGNDDVVFGETLTGRDISLAGVESIVGPLIATVPVRINIHRAGSVESFLQTVQQSILARTPYQHMGMQNIRKVSHDAQHACEAPTGLVVQPDPEYVGSELGFVVGDVVREALHFNPYPLMLACGIRKGGFRVCASFDSSLVEVKQMERILVQLEMAVQQLSKGLTRRIDEISCLPEAELNQIWQWNQTAPLSLDKSSKKRRADGNIKRGAPYPPVVVPWVCDPRNPSLLSPIGCVGELWLEGAFLSGETVESPAWLVAGSSACAGRTGQVQSTGDMVQLQEDNSLVFVGRKENVVSVQGHAVNIADIEAQCAKQLPSNIRASAAVSSGTQEPELFVFIEQPASDGNDIELIPTQHEIRCDTLDSTFESTICATIPISLAVALRKLDKFIHDSLPSYMAPSAYIVIDRMPSHAFLNQLASTIPQPVFTQLRDGFKDAWTKSAAQANLTPNETILRSAWAKILRLTPEQIDVDDNFFRLGGDSVLAMKLVSSLRAQGHGLSVADIFQRMRLGDAAKVLKVNQLSNTTVQPYKPFSTLGQIDIEPFLAEVVRPQLANPDWTIRDVLPVTDTQALDIRATVNAPRTSIQYTMLYMDKDIDRERLLHACHELVRTHEILRTVFVAHESTFLQVILDNLAAPVTMRQTTTDLEASVRDLCSTHIESAFPLGSSFLQIFHLEDTPTSKSCLILGLSHALYDGVSLPNLLTSLEALYTSPTNPLTPTTPFTTYIFHTLNPTTQRPAQLYWRNLLTSSTLTTLSSPSSIQPGDPSIFRTAPVTLPPAPINPEITTATLLTASWALHLARTRKTSDITFGAVTSGRTLSSLPSIESIPGPCYQLTPLRVIFDPAWSATDLLRHVQTQSAQSAEHDFLGFERIAQQAGWTEGKYYDSVVHHQDWDDFDVMPFAGGECKVDILAPHGDAAWPMKVVSFGKDGVLNVGVVGSVRDEEFVDGVLEGLQRLARSRAPKMDSNVRFLTDSEERRRFQNRVAQRKFRGT